MWKSISLVLSAAIPLFLMVFLLGRNLQVKKMAVDLQKKNMEITGNLFKIIERQSEAISLNGLSLDPEELTDINGNKPDSTLIAEIGFPVLFVYISGSTCTSCVDGLFRELGNCMLIPTDRVMIVTEKYRVRDIQVLRNAYPFFTAIMYFSEGSLFSGINSEKPVLFLLKEGLKISNPIAYDELLEKELCNYYRSVLTEFSLQTGTNSIIPE